MTVLTDDAAVRRVQTLLAEAGYYDGPVDGAFGGASESALAQLVATALAGREDAQIDPAGVATVASIDRDPPLCWGARVSRAFRDRVRWIADDLGLPVATGADDLMACMAWESGETFSASVKNAAGSGATGLIQFMPKTAVALGTTVQALAAMTAEDQLNYVYKYFRPFKGRLRNLGDLYMAILWPPGVGKPDSHVLWERGARPTTYRQNAGLDVNRDAEITRGECLGKILERRAKGLLPGNVWKGAQS